MFLFGSEDEGYSNKGDTQTEGDDVSSHGEGRDELTQSDDFKRAFEKKMKNSSSPNNVEEVLKETAKELGMALKCVPTSMEDLIKIGGEIDEEVKKWLENLKQIGASESEALGSTVYVAGVLSPTAAVAGVECAGILICLAGAAAPLIISIAALGLAASQFAEYIEEKVNIEEEESRDTDAGDNLSRAAKELSKVSPALAGASLVEVDEGRKSPEVPEVPGGPRVPGEGREF